MKKLFQKISVLWSKLTGKAKRLIKEHIDPAIKVVEILKDAVNNPALNLIVSLTPFNWDDEAFKIAKLILPKALLEMKIVKDISSSDSVPLSIQKIIEEVRKFTNSSQVQFYEDLAAKLAVMLSDGKLSLDEAAELVKLVYEEKYRSK
jgi:hypothetical protein